MFKPSNSWVAAPFCQGVAASVPAKCRRRPQRRSALAKRLRTPATRFMLALARLEPGLRRPPHTAQVRANALHLAGPCEWRALQDADWLVVPVALSSAAAGNGPSGLPMVHHVGSRARCTRIGRRPTLWRGRAPACAEIACDTSMNPLAEFIVDSCSESGPIMGRHDQRLALSTMSDPLGNTPTRCW